MQTIIHITGQLSGNYILNSALSTTNSSFLRTNHYGGFKVTYPTKKEAYKALWIAYKSLLRKEPEFKHGIRYSPKCALSYDASRAVIVNAAN